MNKKYRIDSICSLVKGIYPTLKTDPGEYPLVVTAAYRRSASTYQLEGPAVCIPLISSTGHGDAALHRVHYQEGKFALANLLVALIPKDPTLCYAKYLYHLLTAKKDEYFVPLMLGTANVSLKVRDIATVEISLPSLDEQQRIVTYIEELAIKIGEAQTLRKYIDLECETLCRSIFFDPKPTLTPMHELVKLRTPDITVQKQEIYHFAGVYSFGRGVFKSVSKLGMEFSYNRLTRLKTDNFVYPKLMAWEGAFGIVPEACNNLVVSPEFPVFEIDQKKVLPEVLDVYFRNPSIWSEISGTSTGTNARRKRLNPQDFLEYKMPLPSIEIQQKLSKVVKRIKDVQPIQKEIMTQLDALLPSILDKAFKGEL